MACSAVKPDGTISPNQMLDGQIGVFESWPGVSPQYIGKVVQRYGVALVLLGQCSGNSFASVCRADSTCPARIRLLSPGDTIHIDSFGDIS